MADNINRADVTLDLRDVYGNTIEDKVTVKFYNQDIKTLSQEFRIQMNGSPAILPDVPAAPTGRAQVFIEPDRYRYTSLFVNVITAEPNYIRHDLFVDAAKARPRGLDFQDLPNKSYSDGLLRILHDAKIGETDWNGLNKRIRASVLNLCAKMNRETTQDGLRIIDQVAKIDQTWLNMDHKERIYGRVDRLLLGKLREYPEKFDPKPGGMHHFPPGWASVNHPDSFKTRDDAGNIQLTFATNPAEDYLADIDLDDHAGIQHVFDVLKHVISSKDTDPYDIHEILRYFQNLDPEYYLL